ncbi:MAG: type I restriction-modification system subunit M N-terminal domain-containing protein [Megasphaera elsdenii]|nr:type I restriction-modification system subunit M N-terminal domain-containing protein [Megasphaera elsdenii]
MGQLNSQDLYRALWASADEMRKVMSAEVYKDYLLGLTFYKYLSDKQLYDVVDLLEDRKPADLDEAQSVYEQVNGEEQDDLKEELEDKYGYAIPPQYTFTAFYHRINDHTFMLSDLRQAFRDIEQSQGGAYEGLFDDFDITSKDLGSTPEKRNGMISAVMKKMAAIDFTGYGTDALGDAYEYLIAQFASESGKKAGEFYTPQSVAKVISRIIAYGRERKEALTMYEQRCLGLIQYWKRCA